MEFLDQVDHPMSMLGQDNVGSFGNTNIDSFVDMNKGHGSTKPVTKFDTVFEADEGKKAAENQTQPKNPILWHRKIVQSQLTDFS